MPTTPSQLVFTEEVQTSTIGDTVPNPPVGSLALFPNQNNIWYLKTNSGAVTALSGVTTVTNSDGTITITGTATAPVVSRAAITGDVSIPAGSDVSTLASVITAGGPTGSGTAVPVLTYDAKGRLTAVTTAATVGSVTATDATIVIGGTATAPTVQRAALTGDVTTAVNVATLKNTGPGATGPIGDSGHAPVVTIDAQGRTTGLTSVAITPAGIGAPSGSGTSTGTNTGDQFTSIANLTVLGNQSGGAAAATAQPTTGVASNVVLSSNAIIKPRDIEARVYVDPANSQGWAGADAGAWINSAFSYIVSTYTNTNGGIIELAAGSYSFSTPIVLANAGLITMWLRGAGDGNGSTILNYTATSGSCITMGGGSGNDGGIQMSDFTITGTAQGNGATAITMGLAATASTAGVTIKNVSIRRFTTGILQNTAFPGGSYAVNLVNCKIQQCTTGWAPFGEANASFGGLIGNNATGISDRGVAGVEWICVGTAFDDNTTTAISMANASNRCSLDGSRFENAGLGTSVYITISAGSVSMVSGGMQEDNISGTASPAGFVQCTGGTVALHGVWFYSGGRIVTQAAAVTAPGVVRISSPIIAAASVAGAIPNWYTPATGGNVASLWGNVGVPNITATTIPLTTVTNVDSRGGLACPATLRPGTHIRANVYATNAATAQTLTATLHYGTGNVAGDATVLTQAFTVGTAALGSGTFIFDFIVISATTALASIKFFNGNNAATGIAGNVSLFAGLNAAATIATAAASFLGVYFSSATASAITIRYVDYEVISQ